MNTQIKKAIRHALMVISLGVVEIANGTASANFSYQPKEPINLSSLLREEDSYEKK